MDLLSTPTAVIYLIVPCAINHDRICQFPPASAFIIQSKVEYEHAHAACSDICWIAMQNFRISVAAGYIITIYH